MVQRVIVLAAERDKAIAEVARLHSVIDKHVDDSKWLAAAGRKGA